MNLGGIAVKYNPGADWTQMGRGAQVYRPYRGPNSLILIAASPFYRLGPRSFFPTL